MSDDPTRRVTEILESARWLADADAARGIEYAARAIASLIAEREAAIELRTVDRVCVAHGEGQEQGYADGRREALEETADKLNPIFARMASQIGVSNEYAKDRDADVWRIQNSHISDMVREGFAAIRSLAAKEPTDGQ